MKNIKGKIQKLGTAVTGIALGVGIAVAGIIGAQMAAPEYECKKKIADKKVITRLTGKFFFEDGTNQVVDNDDYGRYVVGDEIETTCKSWKKNERKWQEMKEFVIFVLAGTIFGTLGIFTTILRIHGFGFFCRKNKKQSNQYNS